MRSCCKQFANTAQPENPRPGSFDEVQECATCGTPLTLTFEERRREDGSVYHVVVGVSD